MTEIVEELRKWREVRNMQDNEFIVNEQVAYMLDECKEILLAKTDEHRAEEYCDVAILAFNGLGLMLKNHNGIKYIEMDKFCDVSNILLILATVVRKKEDLPLMIDYIISTCKYSVEELGYDFQKMMLEKIKVLHSRIQSPTQARDWAENGPTGKWEKSTFAEHIAMVYKPDFESCRISK